MLFKNHRIVIKALKETVKKFKSTNIGKTFWYGYPNKHPFNIAFWIFFKTDSELSNNINTGTTKEIEIYLFTKMIELGYPDIAFEKNEIIYDRQYVIIDGKKFKDLTPIKRTTVISFGSEETVDREFQGNYYNYTK